MACLIDASSSREEFSYLLTEFLSFNGPQHIYDLLEDSLVNSQVKLVGIRVLSVMIEQREGMEWFLGSTQDNTLAFAALAEGSKEDPVTLVSPGNEEEEESKMEASTSPQEAGAEEEGASLVSKALDDLVNASGLPEQVVSELEPTTGLKQVIDLAVSTYDNQLIDGLSFIFQQVTLYSQMRDFSELSSNLAEPNEADPRWEDLQSNMEQLRSLLDTHLRESTRLNAMESRSIATFTPSKDDPSQLPSKEREFANWCRHYLDSFQILQKLRYTLHTVAATQRTQEFMGGAQESEEVDGDGDVQMCDDRIVSEHMEPLLLQRIEKDILRILTLLSSTSGGCRVLSKDAFELHELLCLLDPSVESCRDYASYPPSLSTHHRGALVETLLHLTENNVKFLASLPFYSPYIAWTLILFEVSSSICHRTGLRL